MISRFRKYRVKVYGRASDRVVFFFCPFATRRWQFLLPFLPINRMLKAGYQIVCYDFSTTMIAKTPQQDIEIIESVFKDVRKRVGDYKTKNITNFSCFGVSMGSLFAGYCTSRIDEINKLILNVPYGDIYEHIRSFQGMILLPKSRVRKFIQAAGGESELEELIRQYSPISYVSKLKNKRILLYLALKDSLLQYKVTIKLKKALEAQNTDLTYIEGQKFKHYFTATVNHLKGKIYMDFLNKP